MNKAIFKYKKSDGTVSDRIVLRPSFLKESTNHIKDFDKVDVKYLHGLEISKTGLTPSEVEKYEKLIEEYYSIKFPTLEEFMVQNGLDPVRIQQKSFKKDGISDLEIK